MLLAINKQQYATDGFTYCQQGQPVEKKNRSELDWKIQ